MAQHARRADPALAEAVAEPAAAELAGGLHDREQRDDDAGLVQGIAEPLRDVDDHVHHDRRHDEQCGAVAEGNKPERAGAQRLTRGEIPRVDPTQRLGEIAIRPQPIRLRPMPHDLRERHAEGEHQQAGGDGRPAPAVAGERQRDDRREQAAGGHAHAADAQRQRPAPAEPGDDGHADGQVAAQARAQRHHEERQEEHDGAVDAGEEQEAHAEDGHADADERARAETIRQPALHGAEDAALRARHREGRRQDRLAPAELLAQQHGVGAVRVEHERADQELDAEAGGDDPPAVEERAAGHA